MLQKPKEPRCQHGSFVFWSIQKYYFSTDFCICKWCPFFLVHPVCCHLWWLGLNISDTVTWMWVLHKVSQNRLVITFVKIDIFKKCLWFKRTKDGTVLLKLYLYHPALTKIIGKFWEMRIFLSKWVNYSHFEIIWKIFFVFSYDFCQCESSHYYWLVLTRVRALLNW